MGVFCFVCVIADEKTKRNTTEMSFKSSILTAILSAVPFITNACLETGNARLLTGGVLLSAEGTLLSAEGTRPRTINEGMEYIQKTFNVSFVFDADIDTHIIYKGGSLEGMSLRKALATLFRGSGISYRLKGRYVILKRGNSSSSMASSSSRSSLTRGTRKTSQTIKTRKTREPTPSPLPTDSTELGEVVVTGDFNSPLIWTQTGRRNFAHDDIQTEFSLASSPDLIKALQRISGVTTGVELASGLYVHGGDADENLFLIDGSPLYSVNHTLGLFSSFNTDIVHDVDFYKSGFPARYGGRLSSVVDVHTADGSFQQFHGSYRIGLIDGSFQIDGPIRKDKTSFNFGLRRSWLDLVTRPILAIYNHNHDDATSLSYFFHDLNAKVTNIFNPRSRMSLSLYSGEDRLDAKDDWSDDYGSYKSKDNTEEKFSWGNLNAALDWQYKFSTKLTGKFTAFYTYNRAKIWDLSDEGTIENEKETYTNRSIHSYHSTINDIGVRTAFDFRPSRHHHIRFGTDYTWHSFRPQSRHDETLFGDAGQVDTTRLVSHNSHKAHEWNVYAEDEVTVNDRWSFNAGVNASLFHITGKTFASADPRFAIKYQVSPRLSFKTSATLMSQYVHKIANSFIELPTDYWVPTTARLRPMKSLQWAGGIYFQPDSHWLLTLEGYIKRTRHILQYASWTGLEPPAEQWDKMVMDGRGRFYGLELDATYKAGDLTLQGAYTLSWNKRKYDDFYPEWYYDKFDNRHKANLSARWKLSPKVSAFAVWTFHSGNHITVPTQYVEMPNVPDGKPVIFNNGYSYTHQSDGTSSYWLSNEYEGEGFIYEKTNNLTLPAYHRLDVGFDFKHKTRHGHEIVWNVSAYNLYCHMNSMYVDIDFDQNGRMRVRNHAYFPIIPSVSYTYRF